MKDWGFNGGNLTGGASDPGRGRGGGHGCDRRVLTNLPGRASEHSIFTRG